MKLEAKAKRICAAILAVLFAALSAAPFLSIPARAENEKSTKLTAFAKPSQEIDSELLYKKSVVIDTFETVESWQGGTTIKNLSASDYAGGTKCLLAAADGDRRRTLSVSRSFLSDDPENPGNGIETTEYEEISFSFLVLGATDVSYTVSAILQSATSSYEYTATIASNDWQTVFIDLSPLNKESITSIKITVTGYDADAYISSAALSSLVIGDISHCDLARKYSALYVYEGEITDGGIRVTPKDSSAPVRADALFADVENSLHSTVMITISVSGVRHATLSVSTSESPAWMDSMFSEMTSLTVTSETETYVCCFPADGNIASWSLDFSNVNTGGNNSFLITKLGITLGGDTNEETLDVDASLGSVSKCAYSGGDTIQISGSLSRDAAVEYIDGELGLYAVPGWQSVSEAVKGEPLSRIPVSTQFVFKLSLGEYPTAAGCRFAIAVIKDDSKKLIAKPLWASPASSLTPANFPALSVSSEKDDVIFDSGANGVVIEIDLSKLLRPSNDSNSKLCVWGDSILYFSQSVLNTLAKKVQFYDACKMKYFFRLVCSSDKFGAATDASAEHYAIDVSDRANFETLAAVVSFIAEKYSPSGYILGYGINSESQNASRRFEDPFSLMKQSADCVRLIYSIAAGSDPSVAVILPFDAVDAVPASDVEKRHSAISCAALFDMYISEGGSPVKWAVLASVADNSTGDIPSQSATNRQSGYLGAALSISAEKTSYEELRTSFPSALFYHIPLDETDFSTLREKAQDPVINELPYEGDFVGTITLWDFSKSYSTGMWASSNLKQLTTRASSVLTEVSDLISCRALHLDLRSSESGITKIAATALSPEGTPVSDCSRFEFRLVAFSDAGTASFEIHIGSEKGAWYFPVTVESGKAVSVLCTVPEGVEPTYYAISANASSGVSVQLGKITAHSDTLNDTQLAEKTRQNNDNDMKKSSANELYLQLAAAAVAAVTLTLFIVFNRNYRQKKS